MVTFYLFVIRLIHGRGERERNQIKYHFMIKMKYEEEKKRGKFSFFFLYIHYSDVRSLFLARFWLSLRWSCRCSRWSQWSIGIQTPVLIFRFLFTWFQNLKIDTSIIAVVVDRIFSLLETNTLMNHQQTSSLRHCQILHNN